MYGKASTQRVMSTGKANASRKGGGEVAQAAGHMRWRKGRRWQAGGGIKGRVGGHSKAGAVRVRGVVLWRQPVRHAAKTSLKDENQRFSSRDPVKIVFAMRCWECSVRSLTQAEAVKCWRKAKGCC